MSLTISKDFVLDLAPAKEDRRFIVQTFGLIGPPGSGKSELLAENSYFLQCEPGLNHLECRKSPPLVSYDDFEMVLTKLIQAKQKAPLPFEMIVIDTIDEFVKLCDEKVVEQIRKKFPAKASEVNSLFDYPGSSDKGNPAWGFRKDLVMQSLNNLRQLGVAVAFIGHLDNREIKTALKTIHKQTVSIGGQLGTDLVSWPDHFLNIECKEEGGGVVRKIRTVPTATVDAKSRGGMIPDGWSLVNPKSFSREDMKLAAKENYKKLRSYFE